MVVPSEFVEAMGIKTGDSVKVAVNYEQGVIHYSFHGTKQLSLMKEMTKIKRL